MGDVASRKPALVDMASLTLTRTLGMLPHGVVMALGGGAGRLLCALAPKKRRRIRENLARIGVSTPHRAAWEAGAQVGRTMLEMGWQLWQTDDRIAAQVRVHGLDEMASAVAEGRGVLLAAAHVGNWELGARAAALCGTPVHAIARDLGSPRVEKRIARSRERGGVRTLERGAPGTSVAAYRTLRRGEILACMMDRLGKGRRVGVPFLGAHVRMPTGPLTLALRTGATVVVGDAERAPDGVMDVRFHRLPPLVAPTPRRLALQIAAALEAGIRQHPEQWYWIYRRPASAAQADAPHLDVPVVRPAVQRRAV